MNQEHEQAGQTKAVASPEPERVTVDCVKSQSKVRFETERSLNELRALPSGWDGYGAKPIDVRIVNAATKLASRFPQAVIKAPHVVPTSAGGLQLEWYVGTRSLELHFDSPNRVSYLKTDSARESDETDEGVTERNEEIDSLIRWVFGGSC